MAKRSDRLDGILQIAESKENNAAAVFVQNKQDWDFNREKLEELRAFRDEYRTSNGAQSADQFQSTRQFLSQLSAAIDQQEQQVEQLLRQVQNTEADWTDRRRERMSVEYRDAYHWHDPETGTNIRFFKPRSEEVIVPLQTD